MEKLLNKRSKDGHKGTYGRVGIIGGSLGMSGSITLASKAALRSGCGYVYTIIPKSLTTIMSIKLTESIIVPIEAKYNGHFTKASTNEILKASEKMDVIALGMGLGYDAQRVEIVKDLVSSLNIPMLIDADGLNCIADNLDILLDKKDIVITPHPGELANLLNITIEEVEANRLYYAEVVANKYDITVVLKGHNTVVAAKGQNTYINKTGNSGMATAGSGDALSGIIASFIGQKIPVFEASKLGVYLHGLAGDYAAMEFGEVSLIASDIIDNLHKAIKEYSE